MRLLPFPKTELRRSQYWPGNTKLASDPLRRHRLTRPLCRTAGVALSLSVKFRSDSELVIDTAEPARRGRLFDPATATVMDFSQARLIHRQPGGFGTSPTTHAWEAGAGNEALLHRKRAPDGPPRRLEPPRRRYLDVSPEIAVCCGESAQGALNS